MKRSVSVLLLVVCLMSSLPAMAVPRGDDGAVPMPLLQRIVKLVRHILPPLLRPLDDGDPTVPKP
jgi:hypothetical protein